MDKKEIVKQVKALFNMEVEVADKPVDEMEKELKMAEATLKDGVKIVSPDEEFVVGSEVFVLGEEGEQTPAPDAEHELEDGTIVVTVEGKITEIRPVEVEEPEAEVEVELEKVSADEFNKLNERVKELEAKLVEKEKFEEKFKSVQNATIFLAEEFAKMPGAQKIEIEKAGLKPEEKKAVSKDEKFMKLLSTIKQN